MSQTAADTASWHARRTHNLMRACRLPCKKRVLGETLRNRITLTMGLVQNLALLLVPLS